MMNKDKDTPSPPSHVMGSAEIKMEASLIVSQLSKSLTDRGLSIGLSNLDDGHTMRYHAPLKEEWQRIVKDGLRRFSVHVVSRPIETEPANEMMGNITEPNSHLGASDGAEDTYEVIAFVDINGKTLSVIDTFLPCGTGLKDLREDMMVEMKFGDLVCEQLGLNVEGHFAFTRNGEEYHEWMNQMNGLSTAEVAEELFRRIRNDYPVNNACGVWDEVGAVLARLSTREVSEGARIAIRRALERGTGCNAPAVIFGLPTLKTEGE